MKRAVTASSLLVISLSLLLLATACGGGKGENPLGFESEVVVSLGPADALAFAPDGRLFWADHWRGDVRVVNADGELLEDPVIHFDVSAGPEWGLTGLALDPDFETNRYIYAFFTEIRDPGPPLAVRPVVVRFTENNNRGTNEKVIVKDLPEPDPDQPFNANGSIQFGPDGFLYLTLGDYDIPARTGPGGEKLPQDLSTPIGKMLRIDKEDGSAPPDNPFVDDPEADPRIFAYGFREPFYFAFQPQTGQIYGSDNTSVTCEELNLIESGANYGWPEAGEWPYIDCLAGGQTPAIQYFAEKGMKPEDFLSIVGVKGMQFISGDVYPLLGDGLLVCESGTGLMRLLDLSEASPDSVASGQVVVDDCGRDIAISPDGLIYYSNENEIRRLVPKQTE